eukprot:m.36005 g.36005  ORF g.36005 m.36005 type:complete len:165 (+) comp5368_c0_seq2:120-614(+)
MASHRPEIFHTDASRGNLRPADGYLEAEGRCKDVAPRQVPQHLRCPQPQGDGKARVPALSLRTLCREKKLGIVQALKQLAPRPRLGQLTIVNRLVCATSDRARQGIQVVIDGVPYGDVRFFSLSPQLPAVPKTFPVALLTLTAVPVTPPVEEKPQRAALGSTTA